MRIKAKKLLDSTLFWRVVALIIGLSGIVYFYRYFFFSGFTRFQGDFGDGRLIPLTSSFWGQLLTFSGGWRSLGIYHPTGNALGYSDTLLLASFFVVPLQWLGLNIFLAFQLFLIFLSSISYYYFIRFLRFGFNAPWIIAITGSFIFTFNNSLFVASNHPQLLLYLLTPVLLYYITIILQDKYYTFKTLIFLLGVFFGLITISAFYIGFFIFITFFIFLTFLTIIIIASKQISKLKVYQIKISLLFAGGASLILPLFLSVYLPVLFEGKTRSIELVASYSIKPLELFNLGKTNYLWGSSVERFLSPHVRLDDGEYSMAPTWGVILLSLIFLIALVTNVMRLTLKQKISLSLILTGFVLWIAPTQFNRFFLWEYLYLVPGADAIRAIGRIHIFATGVLVIGLSIAASELFLKKSNLMKFAYILIPVLAFLSIEQLNRLPQQNNFLDRQIKLNSLALPPIECDSFIILAPLDSTEPSWTTQMDAVALSQVFKLPTWNGYTGNTPEGWNLMNVTGSEYLANAKSWKEINKITNGCGFNLEKNTWIESNDLEKLLSQSTSA